MIPQISSISSLEKATYNSTEYTDWVNEALEKAYIDKSKLVIKEIIDKNGKKTKHWVRPGDAVTLDKKGKINSAGQDTSNERQASLDSQLNTATQDNGLNRGRPRTGTSQRDSVLNPTGKQNPGQNVPQLGKQTAARPQAAPQEAAQQTGVNEAYSRANASAVNQINTAKQAIAEELEAFKSENHDEMAAKEASKFEKFISDTQRERDTRQPNQFADRMTAAFDRNTANNPDIMDWMDEFSSKETSNATVTKSQILEALFDKSGKFAVGAFTALNNAEPTDEDYDASDASHTNYEKVTNHYAPEAYAQERALLTSGLPKFSMKRIEEDTVSVLGEGSESLAFKAVDTAGNQYVCKVTSWAEMGNSPAEFLMNHVFLHNAIFPDTRYIVSGITKRDGRINFVLKQPMYSGVKPSTGRLAAYMRAKGFHQVGKSWVDSTGTIRVEDVRSGNAIQTPDGKIHIFDPAITMSPSESYKDKYGLSISNKSLMAEFLNKQSSINTKMLSEGLKTLGGNDATVLFNIAAKRADSAIGSGYNGAYQMGNILRSGQVKVQKGKLEVTDKLPYASNSNFSIHKLGRGYLVADVIPSSIRGVKSLDLATPVHSLATMAVWNSLFPHRPVKFEGIQSGQNPGDGTDAFGGKLDSKGMTDYALCYSLEGKRGANPSYTELRQWASSKGYEDCTGGIRPKDSSYLLPRLSPENYGKDESGNIFPRRPDLKIDMDGSVSNMQALSGVGSSSLQYREYLSDLFSSTGSTKTLLINNRRVSLGQNNNVIIDGKETDIKVPSKNSSGYFDINSDEFYETFLKIRNY